MQVYVVLYVKGSSRTTGSGHNREVVTLYRWQLEQVPLYCNGIAQAVHINISGRVVLIL